MIRKGESYPAWNYTVKNIQKYVWNEQYKKICKSLDKEIVELMRAEQKNNIKLVIKGNGLKRKSKGKLKEIETLSNVIAALEEKRLKFK